jgi:hypothetical protein
VPPVAPADDLSRARGACALEARVAALDPDLLEASYEVDLGLLRWSLVRDPAGRRLEPSPSALRGRGQIQLLTDLGPLDILCRLHDGRGFDELALHSITLDVDDLQLRVIDLRTLIEIKSSTGRARDRLVLPILLALLRERTPAL